jgi:hypothetical protein
LTSISNPGPTSPSSVPDADALPPDEDSSLDDELPPQAATPNAITTTTKTEARKGKRFMSRIRG